jgi:putative oxidoreductase
VLAALSEFVAAILVVFGILTRLSSLALAITMFVAGFLYHADDPFGSKEKALMYFFSYLLIFLTGPGKYAVQRFFDEKLENSKGFWRFILS